MIIYGLEAAEMNELFTCAAKLTPMQISVIVIISSLTGNDHQGSYSQLNSKGYNVCAHEHSVKLCSLMCSTMELYWYSYECHHYVFLRLTKTPG